MGQIQQTVYLAHFQLIGNKLQKHAYQTATLINMQIQLQFNALVVIILALHAQDQIKITVLVAQDHCSLIR